MFFFIFSFRQMSSTYEFMICDLFIFQPPFSLSLTPFECNKICHFVTIEQQQNEWMNDFIK